MRAPWVHTLSLSPLTWLVIACTALTHGVFTWWFQPGLTMHGLAAALDVGGLLLWGVCLARTTRLPYAAIKAELQTRLAVCPAAFTTPAQQCLDLVERIYHEFTAEASRHELEILLANITQLADVHHTLHLRSQQFGTVEQQATMTAMLQKHVASVEHTLHTLQAFSGNLTLLSASATPDARVTHELHFMNEGLHAVIQEYYHA